MKDPGRVPTWPALWRRPPAVCLSGEPPTPWPPVLVDGECRAAPEGQRAGQDPGVIDGDPGRGLQFLLDHIPLEEPPCWSLPAYSD